MKVAMGTCMKNKWVQMDKASGLIKRVVASIEDEVQTQLRGVQEGKYVESKEEHDAHVKAKQKVSNTCAK